MKRPFINPKTGTANGSPWNKLRGLRLKNREGRVQTAAKKNLPANERPKPKKAQPGKGGGNEVVVLTDRHLGLKPHHHADIPVFGVSVNALQAGIHGISTEQFVKGAEFDPKHPKPYTEVRWRVMEKKGGSRIFIRGIEGKLSQVLTAKDAASLTDSNQCKLQRFVNGSRWEDVSPEVVEQLREYLTVTA